MLVKILKVQVKSVAVVDLHSLHLVCHLLYLFLFLSCLFSCLFLFLCGKTMLLQAVAKSHGHLHILLEDSHSYLRQEWHHMLLGLTPKCPHKDSLHNTHLDKLAVAHQHNGLYLVSFLLFLFHEV